MPDTTEAAQGIAGDTQMRFKRDAVYERAKELGATTDKERMELMGLSYATYYRLLRGTNSMMTTATKAAHALGFTVDQAFERVP